MTLNRYLNNNILSDLSQKMVLIGGPRQVGKTTLAQYIGQKHYQNYTYLNWDNDEHRRMIIKNVLPLNNNLIIFDEIHKYKRWKNYLKGLYDVHHDKFKFLVTGSARLDLYRRGGDSLLGRYHYWRLHPFSVAEIVNSDKVNVIKPFEELNFADRPENAKAFNNLWEFGNFPEPLLSKDQTVTRRFYRERLERLIKEDIRDLEPIRQLSSLQILVDLLPDKVGSLFSAASLREDLQVTHKTVTAWLNVLENFYVHFRLYPFSHQRIKALRKQPKLYLWDWSQLNAAAAKLENMIASHLLKFTHYLNDGFGYQTELFFIRDQAGRETDFLVTEQKKPWLMVEVKLNKQEISPSLLYFKEKLNPTFAFQVVKTENLDQFQSGIRLISASKFLSALV